MQLQQQQQLGPAQASAQAAGLPQKEEALKHDFLLLLLLRFLLPCLHLLLRLLLRPDWPARVRWLLRCRCGSMTATAAKKHRQHHRRQQLQKQMYQALQQHSEAYAAASAAAAAAAAHTRAPPLPSSGRSSAHPAQRPTCPQSPPQHPPASRKPQTPCCARGRAPPLCAAT